MMDSDDSIEMERFRIIEAMDKIYECTVSDYRDYWLCMMEIETEME